MLRKPPRGYSPRGADDALHSYRGKHAPRPRSLYLFSQPHYFFRACSPIRLRKVRRATWVQDLGILHTNKLLTEVSSWIDLMAAAINFAIDSDLIRLDFLASSESGIEFERTTCFKLDASIRLTAGPESTPCVAQADTLAAPFARSASAPFTNVPPVSMRSSTSTQFLPSTSPTTFITSATFASSRRLSMIARGEFNRFAKARARSTPPASGETTVSPGNPRDLKYSIITGIANR